MSFWDCVMPHRLLINKSLRKESEALRERIDSYQIEYDRRVVECQIELEEAEKMAQESLDRFKGSLMNELRGEKEYLEAVANDITAYADAYLQRNCLYQMRNIKRKQMDILQEDNDFLSEQMKLIGEEIDLLRERQDELTSFTKVDDIIELSLASGFDLGFDPCDDAKSLLDKVSAAIGKCDDSQSADRFALVRLKGIIQERSEYLPTIKYIAWVIQQKIQYSRQLSEKRNAVRDDQGKVRKEIKNIETEINSVSTLLEELARKIRYYWAHPITYLSADISYAYKEKKDTGDQLKNVGEELHNMASWHSDDQDKWERLQRERRDLSSEMESLKGSIDSKKKERKQWFEKRDYIFQVCKKHEIPLIPENKKETDESRIIEERLSELEGIRIAGTEEAEKTCEQERAKLVSDYRLSRERLETELAGIEKQMSNAIAECESAVLKATAEENNVRKIKDGDDRFFIVKMFSDTPGLENAKKALLAEKKSLGELLKRKKDLSQAIDEMKKRIAELDKQHEKNLKRCRPKYLRPTAAEANEEKKLLFRKDEIEKRRKEGGHESKN